MPKRIKKKDRIALNADRETQAFLYGAEPRPLGKQQQADKDRDERARALTAGDSTRSLEDRYNEGWDDDDD